MKKVQFALAFYNKEKSKDYAGKLDSKKRFVIGTYALPNPNLTGFSFGTADLPGFRGDFHKIEGEGSWNTATA